MESTGRLAWLTERLGQKGRKVLHVLSAEQWLQGLHDEAHTGRTIDKRLFWTTGLCSLVLYARVEHRPVALHLGVPEGKAPPELIGGVGGQQTVEYTVAEFGRVLTHGLMLGRRRLFPLPQHFVPLLFQ